MVFELLSDVGTTTWLAVLFVLVLSWYWTASQSKNLPPSPGIALPFIGHMYLLEKNPRKQFERWVKRFGPAFSLRFGMNQVVVLNTYDVLKEALVKQGDHFSDRPTNGFAAANIPDHTKGVIFSSGANWKEQRTASLAILRTFGMGKNILAEKISVEVSKYIEALSESGGKPTDIRTLTNVSVSNIICSIIFGKRYEFDDPKFIELINALNLTVSSVSGTSLLHFIPALRLLPFDPLKSKQLIANLSATQIFAQKMIDEIKHDSTNSENFIAAYISEMKDKEKRGESTLLDETNLARVIDNLFAAGTETTSTTILWSLLFVLHNPEVQKKIYQEILEQVGVNRAPTIQDRPKLKYLTAFIMETQRIASIVPYSLIHFCNQDATVAGYTIPKGTQILPNLDAVLMDEKIWGDPRNFRPERFLDEQGNIKNREELIPFSIGRRICLGESLAKMELFLYLSSLFQRFEILPAKDNSIPPMKETFGVVVSPPPYEIRCVERQADVKK
ncbi:cytochrome P450 2C15-like [Physella acuta]|uniref:cytochrome P450 2C15-like n=1 Tax=Physella acuta TaxID=109671 RepID=UPI0027DDB360|nr:cytochrome P450 2C15-like [Physella acuta]